MKSIRFESDNGYTLTFAQDTTRKPYILSRIDGDDMSGDANSVKIPGRDGARTYDLTRSQRYVSIEGHIMPDAKDAQLMGKLMSEFKDNAARCFDPGFFGTLYYYAYPGDKGKKLRCRPTGIPAFELPDSWLVRFRVGFESDNAVWESAETMTASLGMTRNNHRFPWYMGGRIAFAFISVRAIIINTTRYNLYPKVTVYNSTIPVHVWNETTGTFLKFNKATGHNHRLVVDVKNATAILEENINNKWVFKENVIHYLTLDSHLTDFVIVPGENEFKILAADGEKPILVITANEIVMGI